MTRPFRIALIASAVMGLVRIIWVLRFPEIDGDAYGHFGISIYAWDKPQNLHVHWVWLPLYHFVVGALNALGLSFRGLRIVNALLAIGTPLLLFDAVKRRLSEREALAAALALAIAPLATVMGTSAQYETAFTFCIVLSVFFTTREKHAAAGIALAVACFLRYEAWGATLVLCGVWALAKVRKKEAPPFVTLAIPTALIVLYILFRWWWDKELLFFFRSTHQFTKEMVARKEWTFREIIHFPLLLPFDALGPAIFLLPFGIRPALKVSWMIPAGLAGFLLLSYYASASPSGERYLISLVPFACVAIAVGALRMGQTIGRSRVFAGITIALLLFWTTRHLRIMGSIATAHEAELRAREAELAKLSLDPSRPPPGP